MNNAGFLKAGTGRDIIIGQDAGGTPNAIQLGSAANPRVVANVPKFVTATGGGYFFSPSRTALEMIAHA